MQGAGNDYIYIDNRDGAISDPAELSKKISDRHFGAGSGRTRAHLQVGQGGRAYAHVQSRRQRSENVRQREPLRLPLRMGRWFGKGRIHDARNGRRDQAHQHSQRKRQVRVLHRGHGRPSSNPRRFPSRAPPTAFPSTATEFTCVSMGNPPRGHVRPGCEHGSRAHQGPGSKSQTIFRARRTLNSLQIIDRAHVKMRVWERGTGETLACGTGACATGVFRAQRKDRPQSRASAPGRKLVIEWRESDNHVLMTGPAEFVFEGEWPAK